MNANKGYAGYSMSNRAVMAYELGEKPISKWRKSEIIMEVKEMKEDSGLGFDINLFKKLTMDTIKKYILIYSSWHHTSSKFNKTDFYSIDINYIESLTDEKILELLEEQKTNRKPRVKLSDGEKKRKEQEKADRDFKIKLMDYQKRYKKINSFLNSNTDFDKLAKIRQGKIDKRRAELKEIWERQLPNTQRHLDNIDDDRFIEGYIYDKTN